MAMTAKEYQKKIRKTVQNGYQSLLLGVGHKLKLFEHLGGESEPRSSFDIAKLACLKERYVREWLHGMVVSDFVQCDPSGKTFWLSAPAKEALQSGKSGFDLRIAGVLPACAMVFYQICDCFKLNGPAGMPYSAYSNIHNMIESLGGVENVPAAVSEFVKTVPGLQEQLERGITCLDVGCGNGLVSLTLASKFPTSHFYAIDICDEPIKTAKDRLQEKALTNVHFLVADAAKLPEDWTSKFDYVTAFDCLHDMPRPDLVLLEIKRVLKEDGRLSVADIYAKSNVNENKDDWKASFCYTFSLFHCMPVSLYFPDGFGFGTMWGTEKATAIIKNAGFEEVEILCAPPPPQPNEESEVPFSVHYLCKKAA